MTSGDLDVAEPTARDLAAIEAEWPVIAAELVVVSAQCRLAVVWPDRLAVCAYRRAVAELAATVRAHARRPAAALVLSTTTATRPRSAA